MTGLDAKLERLSSSKIFIVAVLVFWATVLTVGGSWFIQYRNETVEHTKQLQALETQCNSMGGDYDLYHDSENRGFGNRELPVCRQPKTNEEQQALQRQRAYREGLRSGDIDPDMGDPSGFNEYPY
ncbi:hypothetical protein KC967_02405 [Candidatus Saccharibacteria bacterium]|nr:hypothetical protein [Candidatus Saccharibacteria bacterium]